MKKSRNQIFSFLFACVFWILAGCNTKGLPAPTNPPQQPAPQVSAEQLNEPVTDTSVVEYGHPELLSNNEGPLWTYIRYPQAENFADSAIRDWAQAIQNEAQTDLHTLLDTDDSAEGEINIQFDSYLIDGRFAGIIEQGIISSTGLARPADVLKTFNLDLEHEAFLSNSEILDMSKSEKVLSLLKEKILSISPDAEEYFTNISMDEWLQHIAIGREGILFLLERGAALPAFYGSLRIQLPYEELGDALLLNKEMPPTPEPAPKPAPSLMPEPIAPSVQPQDSGIDPSKPMVALTFDDGPSKHTSRILDVLEQYNGHATFFVIGNLVDARPGPIKRAAGLGNEVIGHSWDHRNLTKLSPDEIKTQILNTHNAIASITGSAPAMFRPPYGDVNNRLQGVSQELGFSIIHWSVDTVDWKTKNADAVYAAIIKDVKDRAIILCHDLYGTTAEAMERVIPQLISQGYQLVTVSELLAYSGEPVMTGKVYNNGN